jgi:hypothetical protein
MIAIALLVVGAFPASANDSQQDACDGLLNALDVLEDQTRANQRAIDNVQALADDAGCASKQVCESLGGAFTPGGTFADFVRLWECADWTFSDPIEFEVSSALLVAACREDLAGETGGFNVVSQTTPGVSGGTATATCFEYRQA